MMPVDPGEEPEARLQHLKRFWSLRQGPPLLSRHAVGHADNGLLAQGLVVNATSQTTAQLCGKPDRTEG